MSEIILSSITFFFNDTATTEIYTLSLHDALPICSISWRRSRMTRPLWPPDCGPLVFGILEQVEERPAELQIEVLRFDGAWVRAGRDRVAVRRPRLVVRGDREVVGGPERVVGDEHRGEF